MTKQSVIGELYEVPGGYLATGLASAGMTAGKNSL